jgi:hypothetical protein
MNIMHWLHGFYNPICTHSPVEISLPTGQTPPTIASLLLILRVIDQFTTNHGSGWVDLLELWQETIASIWVHKEDQTTRSLWIIKKGVLHWKCLHCICVVDDSMMTSLILGLLQGWIYDTRWWPLLLTDFHSAGAGADVCFHVGLKDLTGSWNSKADEGQEQELGTGIQCCCFFYNSMTGTWKLVGSRSCSKDKKCEAAHPFALQVACIKLIVCSMVVMCGGDDGRVVSCGLLCY